MKPSPKPVSLFLLSTLLPPICAQTSFLYKWSFQDSSLQQTVPACTRLPIVITSFDTTTNATKGTPPYYMTALAVGTTPSTTLIGTSDSDASYTVTYPVGTRVLFSVTDKDGNPGGTNAPVVVTAGSNNDCVVTPPTNSFTFTSNVTSELSTCEPLGLSITGGTSPYVVSLVAANAPSVTNITVPRGDDLYTYINRASPGGQLVVAISDANERWANGTTLLSTKGSTNTTCGGLQSSSGVKSPGSSSTSSSSSSATSTTSATHSVQAPAASGTSNSVDQAAARAEDDKEKQNRIIIGVSVSIGVVVLIGAGLTLFFCLNKRRKVKKLHTDGMKQFQGAAGPVLLPREAL